MLGARNGYRETAQAMLAAIRSAEDYVYLETVALDREAGTLVWPNGVDFCPDVLYAQATKTVTNTSVSKAHA